MFRLHDDFKRKGLFCVQFIDSFEQYDKESLLSRYCLYRNLSKSSILDKDNRYALYMLQKLDVNK